MQINGVGWLEHDFIDIHKLKRSLAETTDNGKTFFGDDVASKPKAVITIETHKLTVIRALHQPINVWCEQCAVEVEMTTPEQAADLLGITPREVYRSVENGKLHFVETIAGELFICCRSFASG